MKTSFLRLRSTSGQSKARHPRRLPLRLEQLEDRLTPAVITVTNTGDTIALDTFATLREAITSINNQADINNDVTVNRVGLYASQSGGTPDVINFNIAGGGVQVIAVTGSPLPSIGQTMTINGYSQSGASPNNLINTDNAVLLIQIDGTSAGAGADGLTLGMGSAGSTIRGLDITNFKGNGVVVQSNGNSILGNFIGVDPTGTTRAPNGTFPNSGDGILILNASNNQIGSADPADRNIASGNALNGIRVVGDLTNPATGNVIQGNFVGVAADGVSSVGVRTDIAPAPGTAEGNNLFGIEISGGNLNTVGGTAVGARNVVGFNGVGIIVDNGGQQNVIRGNFVGVGADGVTAAGNLLQGIALRSSNGFGPPLGPAQANEPGTSFNSIGGTTNGAGNTVAFNGTAGIAIFGNPVSASGNPNVGNSILGNSIYLNGRNFEGASSAPTALLGIDLTNEFTFPREDGPTPNDSQGHGAANDPNNFQNAPVLTSFFEDNAGNIHIAGTLHADPSTTYRIEFFANDPDPLHLPAEGQRFLVPPTGQRFINVTTNASGDVSFSTVLNVPVAANQILTATATDPFGNTSEFSTGVLAATTSFSTGLTEFSGGISTGANPTAIVQGSDGSFWFTEFDNNALGRITADGLVTQFSLASLGANTGPLDLVSNPADGFLYFTEFNTGRIGRIDPQAGSDAAILASETQSAVVPSGAGAGVHGITVGPDGNLWFTETKADRVGRINAALTTITEFGITVGAAPVGIVTGPDGALWFTESNNAGNGAIGRITTAGAVSEFLLPGSNNDPESITVGPDGKLWFTEAGSSTIGRITTAGAIKSFALPIGSVPQGITRGPFGLLYFAESGRDRIGLITTKGVVRELGAGLIAPGSQPTDVVAAGRTLWFTEVGNGGNTIGRLAGLSAQERLVASLFVDALGRVGSVTELDHWVALLPPGAVSLTHRVAVAIEGSAEARDHLVKSWYITFLGREALSGEELGFVKALLGGATEEKTLSRLLASPEFFTRAQTLIGGSGARANFVRALYQLLLGREGRAGEVAGWVRALKSNALTRQQVAFRILRSHEYRTDTVAGYYIRLLHREGSRAEIRGWVRSELDLFSIRTRIESSAEHGRLVRLTDYFGGPPADLLTGLPPTFAGVTTINDLYVFRSPSNAANTVFVMTFQPFPGVLTPATADPTLTYDIHIDVTGDAKTDLVFQVTYGTPDANGVQSVTLSGLPSAGFPPNGILAQGLTGENIPTTFPGGQFRSGIQDEPGFFDAGAFSQAVAAGAGGFPRPVGQARNFYGPNGNAFAIVLEIPSNTITFPANNPNKVMGVWATIDRNGTQLSRMGRPLIEDALLPPAPRNDLSHGDRLNDFGASDPANDRLSDPTGFRDDMIHVLTNPNGFFKRNATDAAFLADALLPDLLMFQIGNPGGFGTLVGGAGSPGIFGSGPFAGSQVLGNGRQFRDDVVDIEFNLLTNGAIPTDNVGDDNGLRTTDGSIDPVSNKQRTIAFPYIGAANLSLWGPGTQPNP